MAYIANFTESANTIQPQIHAVIMASRSVRSSDKFHQLLEIILAFGNYMNGAKRGPAYGFKSLFAQYSISVNTFSTY
jgi:hypothetical protein